MESKGPIVIISGVLIALSALGVVFVLASGQLGGGTSEPEPAPAAAGNEATASASETTSVSSPKTTVDVDTPPVGSDAPDRGAAADEAQDDQDDEPVHYKTEIEERAAKSPVSKASKTLQPSWHMVRKQLGDLGDTDGQSAVTQVIEDLKLLMRDPDALDPVGVADTQDALLKQLKERYAGNPDLAQAFQLIEERGGGLRD